MNNSNYKILAPFKNKKIFIIEYEDTINDIYFSKIVKYSLTKEYNELLTEEYNKYQIVSKNNLSLKYNFENFNQIITLNNVVFDSNIDLHIMNNDISYIITLDTSFLNINKNDFDYYHEDNVSEDEDVDNKIKKYKKIKYKLKSMKFTIKKTDQILASVWNKEGILLTTLILNDINNIDQAKKILISKINYNYIGKKIGIGLFNLRNESEKLFSCFAWE